MCVVSLWFRHNTTLTVACHRGQTLPIRHIRGQTLPIRHITTLAVACQRGHFPNQTHHHHDSSLPHGTDFPNPTHHYHDSGLPQRTEFTNLPLSKKWLVNATGGRISSVVGAYRSDPECCLQFMKLSPCIDLLQCLF